MLKLLPVNTVNPATNLLILDRSWQVLQAEERRTQPLKTQNKSRRKGRARTVWIDNLDKRMTSRTTKIVSKSITPLFVISTWEQFRPSVRYKKVRSSCSIRSEAILILSCSVRDSKEAVITVRTQTVDREGRGCPNQPCLSIDMVFR